MHVLQPFRSPADFEANISRASIICPIPAKFQPGYLSPWCGVVQRYPYAAGGNQLFFKRQLPWI